MSSQRLFAVLIVVICLIVPLGWLLLRGPRPTPDPNPKSEPPRLVVLVVFDQMRGDYPSNWKDLFAEGGLRRLQEDGAWFKNCQVAYSHTLTAPGHASILAGCPPAKHGIVENDWYDRKEKTKIYCVEAGRHSFVPELPPPEKITDVKKAASPERMLVKSFADALKDATDGKGKVVALSLKDRSAVLPGGHKPDACYWFEAGYFVTSTYYRDFPHLWVEHYNVSRGVEYYFGKDWTKLRKDLDYERYVGEDDVVGEWKGYGQGRVFPHPTTGGQKKIGKEYYQALANSPFGNDILLELTKMAIDAEELGKDDVPDLLSVSFSSNDLIGHCWGPDSQEVLDVTLRSDDTVKQLLEHLDLRVGKGRYTLILTSDHGVYPIPEFARKKGHDAGRISPTILLKNAEEFLQGTFGIKGPWIESAADFDLYLNQRLLEGGGLEPAKVEQALADWLCKQEGIQTAYTRHHLQKGVSASDALGQRVQRSFNSDRSGDVIIVVKPYHLLTTRLEGTNHGTPHPLDTHVPFMVYGPGIRPGERKEEIAPQAAAAIFARSLGIKPPATAETPVPPGLFVGE